MEQSSRGKSHAAFLILAMQKLWVGQHEEILRRWRNGELQQVIASNFGVSDASISLLLKRLVPAEERRLRQLAAYKVCPRGRKRAERKIAAPVEAAPPSCCFESNPVAEAKSMFQLVLGGIESPQAVRAGMLPTAKDRKRLSDSFIRYREECVKELDKLLAQGYEVTPRMCPGVNEAKDIELDTAKQAELERRARLNEDYRSIGRSLRIAVGIAAFKIRKLQLAEGPE